MLDRQHLAILLEVDRLGSLTAAADRLNLTQSALSHTIRRFEERHGVKVWQKQGRHLRLSQAGKYLLALAQRLLPQMEEAERVLGNFATGQRGSLRIGMECYPCQKWLMPISGAYMKAWPDVDLDVSTAFRFDGIEALLGYEIDLLITPDPVERPEIKFIPVFDYELVLAVPEHHRLVDAGVASPADLMEEDLITFPVTVDRLDVFTRFLLPVHCRPNRLRTAETTELMLQLVANKRGVCVIPDWILRQDGADLPIRAVHLGSGRGLEKSIHVGFRREDEDVEYLKGFLSLAQESCK
jgi:LysR family transcriptional regulator for metE and metH